MKQKIISVALFGVLNLPLATFAETNSLGEVVVTATRMPQSLEKTISATTVLNEQEIRNSSAPDVATLLRSLSGVEIVQTGGLGSQSSTFLRGTNSNQVLVLIDGVRVNSATSGATALEHIMLDSIQRIEIVRGNVSSLYGSEAIGGVIQLFTKQGRGTPALNASVGLGSYGTQRTSAGFSGEVESTAFSVNLGKVKTDGLSSMNPQLAPNANPNNNGYDNNTINAQVRHRIGADHALSASVFSTRGNTSFDNAFGLPSDQNNSQAGIDKYSLAIDDQLSPQWHSQVRLAQGADDYIGYTNYMQTSQFKTVSKQVSWQNNFEIATGQHLNASAEYLGQSVASDTAFTQSSRTVNSVLGGYVGDYGVQQVQLNVRQDNHSDFGAANTGLLGYGVRFADDWRVTASVSNAFKAPTFNDMYYPLSGSYQGNASLKPERSQNQELGLHYAVENQRVDMVYFDNRINDLIAIDAGFTTMININQAAITGQELSYVGDFANKHLKASLTLQNPRDINTGVVLARRAKQFASISAAHDFADWSFGAEARYSGERQDGVTTLPSYALFNLTTRYAIDRHFSLSARADNVLNRDYAEAYRYNTLGRTLFVSVNYQ